MAWDRTRMWSSVSGRGMAYVAKSDGHQTFAPGFATSRRTRSAGRPNESLQKQKAFPAHPALSSQRHHVPSVAASVISSAKSACAEAALGHRVRKVPLDPVTAGRLRALGCGGWHVTHGLGNHLPEAHSNPPVWMGLDKRSIVCDPPAKI